MGKKENNIYCQYNPSVIGKVSTAGITLVALVVTIVILLILAGITIVYVFGDNGVFGQASQAKIQTEIAKVEERAQTIYSEKLMETASSTLSTKVETSSVIEQLISEKYPIEKRPVEAGDITGISLDKENITMGKNKTAEINVTYEGVADPFVYYLEVQGKYYQMRSNRGFITIDREPSNLTKADFENEGNGEGGTATLKVESNDENVATAALKAGSNNIIEIISKEIEGEKETTITVTYGTLEAKTCKVKVIEPILATKITLDKPNGTVTGGLSYKENLQLKATIEPENVTEKEVTWTSSNPELATVDSNGLIKAGAKGGDVVITATTKDGSNKSAKCEVIVEIFGAVDENTRDYTDSTYTGANKTIKVPGGYAVGTSENVSKIENGFVIQDNKGNQFVWVPVDNTNEMFEAVNGQNVGILYDFSGTSSTKREYSSTEYREPDVVTVYDNTSSYYAEAGITGITNATQFKTQLQNEFNQMKTSVEANKGFYIGRYETGDLSKGEAVSKRNNIDINRQNWYVQYQKCKTIANGTKATSSMLWGCQWDATMRWFQKSKDSEVAKFPTNSEGKGNYKGTQGDTIKLIPTGSNTNYKVNNIYDMAGNVYDWTLEAGLIQRRIARRRPFQPFSI